MLIIKNCCLLIVMMFIFSCNSDQPETVTSTSHSPATKLIPELSTGTKTEFKKIGFLPPGLENIFGYVFYRIFF